MHDVHTYVSTYCNVTCRRTGRPSAWAEVSIIFCLKHDPILCQERGMVVCTLHTWREEGHNEQTARKQLGQAHEDNRLAIGGDHNHSPQSGPTEDTTPFWFCASMASETRVRRGGNYSVIACRLGGFFNNKKRDLIPLWHRQCPPQQPCSAWEIS